MQQSNIQAQVPVRLPQYQQQLDVIAMAGNVDSEINGIYASTMQIVMSEGAPMLQPPVSTIQNNGVLTLGTKISSVYFAGFIFCLYGNLYSSNNGLGVPNPAAWYQFESSNTGLITIFQNTYSGSGKATLNPNPTPFTSAIAPVGNVFNAATGNYLAIVTAPVIAGGMGANGSIEMRREITYSNSSNTKQLGLSYAGRQFIGITLPNADQQYIDEPIIWNRGLANINAGSFFNGFGGGTGIYAPGLADSTQLQTLTTQGLLSNATDWIVHEHQYAAVRIGA